MRAEHLTRKMQFHRLGSRCSAAETPDVLDLTKKEQAGEGLALFPLRELIESARRAKLCADQGFSDQKEALVWCARHIDDSPTGRMLMAFAARAGWRAGFSDLKNQGFSMDPAERILCLDHFCLAPRALGASAYFRNVLLTGFLRALRDLWHAEKLGETALSFVPEQSLILERIRAADCDTVTILCGWELRGAGFTEAWRHLLGAEEGDMAIVFSRFLEGDPGALFSGAALAYAFRQWYADPARVSGVDHETLEMLDRVLDGAQADNPFGVGRVDAAALEGLAGLPDGKGYLAGLGAGILRDPFFVGLNDPINRAHLAHLVYDTQTVTVNNVPFRDAALARLIFPQEDPAALH